MKEKFDPFEKVLVREGKTGCHAQWKAAFRYEVEPERYMYCHTIPYEGNEHLYGTTDDYEELYKPKDGDFVVYGKDGIGWNIGIFQTICASWTKAHHDYATLTYFSKDLYLDEYAEFINDNIRPATEEEKQELLSNLHKIGKDWDVEKKDIVDYVPFVPQDGDFVVFTHVDDGRNEVADIIAIYKCPLNNHQCHDVYCYLGDGDRVQFDTSICYHKDIRPATEEEKREILSKLHGIGKNWNAEEKKIVGYVPPYKPEDGDFVRVEELHEDEPWILIWKGVDEYGQIERYVSYDLLDNDIDCDTNVWGSLAEAVISKATEEDKQKLLSKLHEIGKDWDAERKGIVVYKWKPEDGDIYYYPYFDNSNLFDSVKGYWDNELICCQENERLGWMFETKEECKAFCEKLNHAIEMVK